MPFNGTGTFTRLNNWTNDANNNLPISSTKFDAEDNDFASGLTNCLTRDGQGTPTSALTWTQPLTLNKSSDGVIFATGRTGGSNNPSLQFNLVDATGIQFNITTAQQLSFSINGTNALTISGNRNVAIPVPASGTALAISGKSGTPGLSVTAQATTDIDIDVIGIAAGSAVIRFSANNSGSTGIAGVSGASGQWTPNSVAGDFIFRNSAALRWSGNNGVSENLVVTTSSIKMSGPVAGALVDMTPDTGTWSANLSGAFTLAAQTFKFSRQGNIATIWVDTAIAQVSSAANALTVSGVPASITPANPRSVPCVALQNNALTPVLGAVVVNTNNTLTIGVALGQGTTPSIISVDPGPFTNGATCGINAGWCIVYPL